MATLSMARFLPAALEVDLQRLRRRHDGPPSQQRLGFLVAVAGLLPERMPRRAVVRGRKLPLRPVRIPLPEAAQSVAHGLGQVNRREAAYVAFVEPEELPARRHVIIHDIEHLAVDAWLESGEHDGFGAVVDERQRNGIAAAEV